MSNAARQLRKSTRFTSDKNTQAAICLSNDKKRFHADHIALVKNESHQGSCLVLVTEDKIDVGIACRVKVGKLSPLNARVRWVRLLNENVLEIGVQYVS